MALEFTFIPCPIDDCKGEVIWVVSEDENYDIWCPTCKQTYRLTIRGDQ